MWRSARRRFACISAIWFSKHQKLPPLDRPCFRSEQRGRSRALLSAAGAECGDQRVGDSHAYPRSGSRSTRSFRLSTGPASDRKSAGDRAPFYLLPGLNVEISASEIRMHIRDLVLEAPEASASRQALLPSAVVDYIRSRDRKSTR